MTDVTVYGFPISTFVNIVRLFLTHKNVAFDFHDLEPKMGSPTHLSLHPFNRVPILDHAGFRIYETSANRTLCRRGFCRSPIAEDLRQRARMHQWISAVGSYYYPYMSYHLSHERLIYPARDCTRREGGRSRLAAHHGCVGRDGARTCARTRFIYLATN